MHAAVLCFYFLVNFVIKIQIGHELVMSQLLENVNSTKSNYKLIGYFFFVVVLKH